MNKKIFNLAIVITLAIVGTWNISQNRNGVKVTDLVLNNVEALASGEMGGGTCPGAGPHFSDVSCHGGGTICAWCHTHVYGRN